MKVRTAKTAMVAMLLAVGVAAGCSDTTIQSSDSGFHVSTPDGQVSVSLNSQLPPNWPASFPLPNGAKAVGSGSLGNGTTHMVAVYETRTSGPDTISFYESNSELKTSDAKSIGIGSNYLGSLRIGEPYNGSLTVASHGGTTYLVVVLESPAGTSTTSRPATRPQ